MWCATFKRPGDAAFVYFSTTGAVLGRVRVPMQTFHDGSEWIFRTPEEAAMLFRDWNLLHDD
jgi:hypothetical protein